MMLTFSMMTTFPVEWQMLGQQPTQYGLEINIIFLIEKKKVSPHWKPSLFYKEGFESKSTWA